MVDKNTVFRLKLTDEAGKPVSDAAARAALKMTTMDMGKNEVDLVAKGNGEYAGTGKFSMAGPWTVDVNARVENRSGQQSFPVVVQRE
jgi:nitrogen fixation protein FixH